MEGILQYLKFVKVLNTYVENFMWKATIPSWGKLVVLFVLHSMFNVLCLSGSSNKSFVLFDFDC